MKKTFILLIAINTLIFGSNAEKALSLYEQGKYNEAAAIASSLDESKAVNLYVKAVTEKIGNEAASLYRKALAADDISTDLSRKIYLRLAGYYEAVGIPGSVSVMLDRATMTVTSDQKLNLQPAIFDTFDSNTDSVEAAKMDTFKRDTIKTVEMNNSAEDTVDFAAIEEPVEKKVEIKPVITKSVDVSRGPKVFYTLQTGAFGLEVNALKMKKDLGKSFKNITIKKQKSGDRTLHKVRVGRFNSQQEALDFAALRLRPKKIMFRIVKE